ncbi:type III restriction-modification system endonuclease [Thiothrix winogradskyi]|uniref:DEAD/DEAH box helicase family protein n=1 Tax=Thiothrix winogradskyi TaxID=96472 RepID=A0ABY3T0L1_9GAMM|nr:DEAD/DEAH box helicase family protein [Thiothrix winogradskyi]UJS25342.1 DEAD/DEAH box helicase family protein [Thiothrix winogradskyi]
MKIQFDSNLAYQQQAVEAILGVFEGQETTQTTFTVTSKPIFNGRGQGDLLQTAAASEYGIGNRLMLLEDELLDNVRRVQLQNGLKQTSKLDKKALNFTVEMETGTGKTYVYLRSIFELHLRYGFTKFIIVVPSIAIKEGVYKSLQITNTHFKDLYQNIRYDYFIYDSQKREQVRSFATSDYVQIMVINIDAFRKSFSDPDKETKANLIHRADDRLNGQRPIEFIRDTCPIVIIDEPQSVDRTDKAKEAIASLNPLCTLRYSATHADKHQMLYKLDAIDAFEQKLVKQIEVKSLNVQDGHNKAYLKLLSVDNRKSPITATIELDALQKGGVVKRISKKLKAGADLLEVSGGRDLYDGYIINDIVCTPGSEYIDFTSKPDILKLGQAIGDVDEDARKRLQIRQTIEKHLERELLLNPMGIKVLSLFFIDRVANYRSYDAAGHVVLGKYAQWFEAEYRAMVAKPKYRSLFGEIDPTAEVSKVHDGYFSADKRKKGDPDSLIRFKDSSGTTAEDESTYNLIMKEKEKLLSFDSKLRFIFSHSALREGWDNPNVFQICTLNETASTLKKRQEIGRGLRLAVNQQGERIQGFTVNTLTVMANESYEAFAAQLQREYEQDAGIRFDVKKHIKNADTGQTVQLNKQVYLSPEFTALWDRIKHQTTYRVNFTPENLINTCASKLGEMIVGKTRFESIEAKLHIDRSEIAGTDVKTQTYVYDLRDYTLPDIVTYLQDATNLTRRSVIDILQRSGRLKDFKSNPQKFIEQATAIIQQAMRLALVDGIKYHKIGDEHFYAQELFESAELRGYLNDNMQAAAKCVYEHVVYDSDVEASFALGMEQSEDVKLYAKLPGWFKIDTPLGTYNPDWAVLVEQDGKERLYFVVETKGTLLPDALRPVEDGKIKCGRAHFAAMENDVRFTITNEFREFVGQW